MNRKNLILGGILALLIALAYVYEGPFKTWRASTGKPDNFLANLNIDEVNNIEVNYQNNTTILEKTGDRWKISGTKDFYLKQDEAAMLISRLKEAVKAEVELVSENEEKKDEFNVGAGGSRVKLGQGNTVLAAFIVGQLGSDYTSTYIAENNSSKTYALKADLNSILARSDWYDYAIFSSDKAAIAKIRFQYPGREFTIEKKEDKWAGTLPVSFPVSAEKIDPILDIMANLTAVKIPQQAFTGTGLEKNSLIVQATGEGIDHTIMIGDKNDDGNYFAKNGNSDNIYLISAEQRDQLNKRTTDLR
ncbi:MAG: DUF4340 domain-containing protein [Planctomycetes bacterium]|jgi:hypothetical protein|nr:DUF4340 domain-containing protein [Planctomycetota bacterium]